MAYLLASSCHPNCVRAMKAQVEHDPSQAAALVAVHLISSARVILELDSKYTDFSAQYLCDRARPSSGQDLTVKAALKFILREGIPKLTDWAHLGCTIRTPPLAAYIPRISMRGEVIEANTLEEGLKLLAHQPVGARLHVFSPEIDNGIYTGLPSNQTRYVGLRDVVILVVEEFGGDTVADVTICYKKKSGYVKVSLTRMFLSASLDGDDSKSIGPTALLVDFCIPRLSK